MKRTLALVLLAAAALAIYAYTERTKFHAFSRKECFNCHQSPFDEPLLLVKKPVSEMCSPCHRIIMKTSSHPVGIAPWRVVVPPDLPLRDGLITCATCHNIHGEKESVFGRRTFLLRRPVSHTKFFCVACHEENVSTPGHRELTDVAHVGSRYRAIDFSGELDPLSAACIGCHDGTVGVDAAYTLGPGQWMHIRGPHPIGVDYREASGRKRNMARLRDVDGRLRLFGGKIGCGTCHDMFSTLPGKLVMRNSRSRLCRECHYL